MLDFKHTSHQLKCLLRFAQRVVIYHDSLQCQKFPQQPRFIIVTFENPRLILHTLLIQSKRGSNVMSSTPLWTTIFVMKTTFCHTLHHHKFPPQGFYWSFVRRTGTSCRSRGPSSFVFYRTKRFFVSIFYRPAKKFINPSCWEE